jgi:isoquinoline 1-oxidoreductase beta subunit
MHHSRIRAGLDGQGMPVAWTHHLVGESIVKGTAFEGLIKDGIDHTSVEGAVDLPYAIPNQRILYHPMDNGVPVLWWRAVGHTFTAFVVESFIDELAAKAGKDPLAYRLALLKDHPRHRAVLEQAAAKAGWGRELPKGRGLGLAVHASFGSFAAEVAEVAVQDGQVRVERVVVAIDCGFAVNPDTVVAQMESGVVFGLSAALYGEITLDQGRVQQSNYHDYPILRIDQTPQIEVLIVESGEALGGIGEPGTPPIAPAVANAIYAATGKRLRRLPIRAEDLRTA